MKNEAASVSIAILTLVLAGCVGALEGSDAGAAALQDDDPERKMVPAVPDYDFTGAVEDVHPHDVPALHTAHHNLELVEFDPIMDGLEPSAYASGYTEVDYHHGRGLGVVASLEGQRAATIFDVSEDGVETVSHVYSGSENWDVRFSDDGGWLFYGCQGPGRYGAAGGPVGGCVSGPMPQTPGMDGYQGSGIVAVNISDPANPEVAAYTPSAAVHNLYTATIDGTIYVANDETEIFSFHPASPHFEKASQIPGTHDLAIQKHPVTGDWLLYTGNSSGDGITIWDLNDPANPQFLSSLNKYNGHQIIGWHEQTPAPTLIDGRHITLAGTESFVGQPNPVSIIDTTDPADPKLLGQWTLPGEYTPQGNYKFSSHNIDVSPTGQVVMGAYHTGVWVFDISTEDRMRFPVTLGFYQPHEISPQAGQQATPYGKLTGSPYVWGAMWTNEAQVLAPDLNSGMYLLEPTWETAPAPSSPGG